MKITYFKRIDVIVRYDEDFDYRINDCPITEIQTKVEKQMWKHNFKTADIIDPYTGEVFLIVEKDY